jgi:DNA polymerase V
VARSEGPFHDAPFHDAPCRDAPCQGDLAHDDLSRGSGRHPAAAAPSEAAATLHNRPAATRWGPEGAAAAAPAAIDLARLLIRDPQHALLLRVCGESMRGAGIRHGDLLVVERDRQARSGAIVVARLGEGFTLKRLQWRRGRCWLEPAHPAYPPLDLERVASQQGLSATDVQIWGVAVHVIHTL